MLERVIDRSNFITQECNVIAEFNNGSTFKLVYHFSPINQPGAILRLSSFDMEVEYWIKGHEDQVIKFTKSNVSNDQCIVIKPQSMIKFVFKNYQLSSGRLYARYTFNIPDCELGCIKDTFEGYTGINII